MSVIEKLRTQLGANAHVLDVALAQQKDIERFGGTVGHHIRSELTSGPTERLSDELEASLSALDKELKPAHPLADVGLDA
jgi:hypothetical protein